MTTVLEARLDPGAVRSWARANGIPVSKTGAVQQSAELQARNSRPDLFALADDLVEAELIRTGRLGLEEPTCEVRIRDELADAIANHAPPGVSISFRETAEALLVEGWMRRAAA